LAKVRLTGTRAHRSASGARVVVEASAVAQTQELRSQSSFLSLNDLRLRAWSGSFRDRSRALAYGNLSVNALSWQRLTYSLERMHAMARLSDEINGKS
jgi:hypothetical protein